MPAPVSARGLLLGTLGGAIGGVVGYYIFYGLYQWGFYGMMVPGAVLGLGVGWCTREHSKVYGLLAAIAGLGLGVFTEWSFRPFAVDKSLQFFLKNLQNLTPVTQIMIVLGAVFAYWFGQGRERFVRRRTDSQATGEPSGSDHSPV